MSSSIFHLSTPTLTVTPSPTRTPTITPTPAFPVDLRTPMPRTGGAISIGNIGALQETVRFYGSTPYHSSLTAGGNSLFIRDGYGFTWYDYPTGRLVLHLDLPGQAGQDGSWNLSLQTSLDGRWAVVDERWLIHFLTGQKAEIRDLFEVFQVPSAQFRLSPDGSKLTMDRCPGIYVGNKCSKPEQFQILDLAADLVSYTWSGSYLAIHGWDPLFSPDGNLLLARVDNRLFLWRISNAQVLANFPVTKDAPVFSPDSFQLAVQAPEEQGGGLTIYDLSGVKPPHFLSSSCQTAQVLIPLVFSADGTKFAARDACQHVIVWSLMDGQQLHSQKIESLENISLSINADGSLAQWIHVDPHTRGSWVANFAWPDLGMQFLGTDTLTFWNQTGLTTYQNCSLTLASGLNSCAGDTLTGTDGKDYRYAVHNGRIEIRSTETLSAAPDYAIRFFGRPYVNISAIDPFHGVIFYSGGDVNASVIQDLKTQAVLTQVEKTAIYRVVISRNGRMAAMCTWKGDSSGMGRDRLVLVDLEQKTVLDGRADTCNGAVLAYSSAGSQLAFANLPPKAKNISMLYLMEAAKPEMRLPVAVGCQVRALAFPPDDSFLAVACADDSLRFLDPRNGKELGRIPAYPGVDGMAFSDLGDLFALHSNRGVISLWAIPPFSWKK